MDKFCNGTSDINTCINPYKLNVKPQCYRFGERGVMSVSMPVVINGAPTDEDVVTLIGGAAARLGRADATPPATMMRWHDGRLWFCHWMTGEITTLIATARRLLLDPVEIGPIRLLGVGFSGLSDVRQESLFPELEQQEAELGDTRAPVPAPEPQSGGWRVGDDVSHPGFGHGWVQGAGHGVMTVRFETRASGPGTARTFGVDDGEIVRANPVDSLDWPDYVSGLAEE